VSGCSGAITAASQLGSAPISLFGGITTINGFSVLVTTMFGTCLYVGILSGWWTSPTRSFTAYNRSYPLLVTLSGFCTSTVDLSLTVNTGATITG
jgi:hypothetical protein